MKFEIDWLVDNKVIYVNVHGDVAPESFRELTTSIHSYIDESDEPLVHLVSCEKELGKIPVSLNSILDVLNMSRHERFGWIINYGTDEPVKRYVSTMLGRIMKSRHRRFTTIEDALTFLSEVVLELPPMDEMIKHVETLHDN